ncbi:MAG: S8 family serine peptidase [Bdellovibrionales bacterium]|nr:S8 family serine peptidase [Bdellovibrionales bacterium]
MTERAIYTVPASIILMACLATATGFGLRETSRMRGPDSVPSAPRRHQDRPAPVEPSRKRTVVAVVDTGLDLSEEKFAQHLWTNPNEELNGRDDDGNGLIDDLHGWDFVMKTSALTDSHGHGTHVTGLILERAPEVEILPLAYYAASLDGNQAMELSLQALEYAIRANVDIINYSGGGVVPSDREKAILELAQRKGILVVAAAGNEATNTDVRHFYPANYSLSNILSVGAVSRDGTSLKSSNFGLASVHFAALGDRVISTLPGGRRGEMTGTSQATARVTGLAARLIVEARRSGSVMSPELVIDTLSSIASYDSRLSGRTKLSSRLEDSSLQSQVNSVASSADSIDELVGLLRRERAVKRDPAFWVFR